MNSNGKWIAFLDDDDLWHPEKLERQIAAWNHEKRENIVIGCRMIAVDNGKSKLLARRAPKTDEKLWDYLFIRREFSSDEAQIQTSTLFMSANFARKNLFRDLSRHQDWDFLFLGQIHYDMQFIMLSDALVTLYRDEDRLRVSNKPQKNSYLVSYGWINQYKQYISEKCKSDFVLTVVIDRALRSNQRSKAIFIFISCFTSGVFSKNALLVSASMIFLPKFMRKELKSRISGKNKNVGDCK